MHHHLTITANNRTDVAERVLQVTRYRGYQLSAMTLNPTNDAQTLLIQLSVSSDKPIDLLTRQLQKLYDVREVRCENIFNVLANAVLNSASSQASQCCTPVCGSD